MRLSFIIHRVFHEGITSILPLIKIPGKKFIQRPADGPITVTRQTVLQPLMDLKISSLHDSLLLLSNPVTNCVELWGEQCRSLARKLSDTDSHISRLSYCFVSGHVMSPFQTCTDSSLCTVVHALHRAKSLGPGQLLFVFNLSLLLLAATVTLLHASSRITAAVTLQICFWSKCGRSAAWEHSGCNNEWLSNRHGFNIDQSSAVLTHSITRTIDSAP